MVTRRRLLGVAAAAAATTAAGGVAGVYRAEPARADYSTKPVPTTDWGTWQGWGTSLCWWANVFGAREDVADLFFTTKDVAYDGQQLPGLGMNIVRYNAGACTWNEIDGERMVESPNIPRYKQLEGFWLDWHSEDPASSSWDWSVDERQRAALLLAQDRGANLLELFSNSPLWWMCRNHNPSGDELGGNNLQEWNYRQHARYMATVAQHAADNWGVRFTTVAPFNEPIADWWKATGTQEGCHIDRAAQAEIVRHLRAELDARGLGDTMVSASDESLFDQATGTWNSFDAKTKAVVAQVNVHGYQGSGGRRDILYDVVSADGKPLWQSEHGDGDGSGMTLAKELALDMRWLHPTSWSYWQVIDGTPPWALIQATFTSDTLDGELGPVNPKYFVLAQYSRHIRPGMRIIDSGDGNTVAAYDEMDRRLVLVTVNGGDTEQAIGYDLSNFGTVDGDSGAVRSWTTTTDEGGDRYVAGSDIRVADKAFSASFPARTVRTFEIDNVVP